MSIKNAFNQILKIRSRNVTLTRLLTPTNVEVTVAAAQGNYYRNMSGPDSLTIPGREYVFSKDALLAVSYPVPVKRGDRITDVDTGVHTITDVHEMSDLGGAIIGYRVRTS